MIAAGLCPARRPGVFLDERVKGGHAHGAPDGAIVPEWPSMEAHVETMDLDWFRYDVEIGEDGNETYIGPVREARDWYARMTHGWDATCSLTPFVDGTGATAAALNPGDIGLWCKDENSPPPRPADSAHLTLVSACLESMSVSFPFGEELPDEGTLFLAGGSTLIVQAYAEGVIGQGSGIGRVWPRDCPHWTIPGRGDVDGFVQRTLRLRHPSEGGTLTAACGRRRLEDGTMVDGEASREIVVCDLGTLQVTAAGMAQVQGSDDTDESEPADEADTLFVGPDADGTIELEVDFSFSSTGNQLGGDQVAWVVENETSGGDWDP